MFSDELNSILHELNIKLGFEEPEEGLKVGDYVKVLRKAESCENGWDCGWLSCMDPSIGKIGIITSDKGVYGFRVKFDGTAYSNYLYPGFVLEKVNIRKD